MNIFLSTWKMKKGQKLKRLMISYFSEEKTTQGNANQTLMTLGIIWESC